MKKKRNFCQCIMSEKAYVIWCDGIRIEVSGISAKKKAAFIARACNAHEALVEALKGVIKVADRKTAEFDAAKSAIKLSETDVGDEYIYSP